MIRLSPAEWGYGWWGVAWLALGFLVPELLSKDVLGVAPWLSLSGTTRHAIKTYPVVGYGLLGILIGVTAHFFTGRKLLPCLIYGVTVSVGAHLMDGQLP